jgi:hypothetical protein
LIELVQTGIKEFTLDDETALPLDYMQYIDTDSASYLLFVNEAYNNSIYFYNYETTDFARKIQYDKEGSNGVHKIRGCLYVNDDSIFVYNYWGYTLYLTNAKAEVKDKYKLYEIPESLDDRTRMIYPSPYPQTATPIKKIGNKIYLFGFVAGEIDYETSTNRPNCTILDLERDTFFNSVSSPPQYIKYNWGGGFMRLAYYDVADSALVVSFPVDHNIIRVTQDKHQETFYAGSSRIDKIKSYPQRKGLMPESGKERIWMMGIPDYQNILYDKYRKLYYRIARLPWTDFKPGERGNKKPVVVIVLDSRLYYLGEVLLPDSVKWYPYSSFVSREGLDIQVITNDEDKLTYYLFNVKKNEE